MKQGATKFLTLLLLTVLSVTFPCSPVLADDDAKTGAPTSTDAAKLDAPKPGLTERERWLLDRVEQLERRVAELESKSQPATTAAAPAASPVTASKPGEAEMVAPPAGSPNTAAAGATLVTPPAAAVRQSSEQATATTSTPEKAAPFAFADFTWLNGNPRTKTVPLDTPFFTPEIRADVDYIYDFHHPKDDTLADQAKSFARMKYK